MAARPGGLKKSSEKGVAGGVSEVVGQAERIGRTKPALEEVGGAIFPRP